MSQELGLLLQQPLKSGLRELYQNRVADGVHARRARFAGQDPHLADALAGRHVRHHAFCSPLIGHHHPQTSTDEDVQTIAGLSLSDQGFSAGQIYPLNFGLDLLQRGFSAGGGAIHERAVDHVARCKMREQSIEQHRIAARAKRQVQIGFLASRGPARIDNDDATGRVAGLCGHHALVKDRMTPGGVGADEDQEIGGFEILIAARHGVATERALVARHARGHAQPGIGVDVGGADEALGKLVDDVIVLGQNLAGDIECDRIRSMLLDWPSAKLSSGTVISCPLTTGASNRPSRPMVSASAEPFAHSRPKLAG